MIVKKLRDRKNWSQEQLAQFSSLSIRTIQRIESGSKASLESLKSLAAVFEIDISKLEEEIDVIDKQTEQWKALHWFIRWNFWGIRSREEIIRVEYYCAATGMLGLMGGFFILKAIKISAVFFATAYVIALLVRYGDKRSIW